MGTGHGRDGFQKAVSRVHGSQVPFNEFQRRCQEGRSRRAFLAQQARGRQSRGAVLISDEADTEAVYQPNYIPEVNCK